MSTRDLHTLDRELLNAEFEVARAIYEQARAQGYGPVKAAAMVYRHGVLDGKAEGKQKADNAYRQLGLMRDHLKRTGQGIPKDIEEVPGDE